MITRYGENLSKYQISLKSDHMFWQHCGYDTQQTDMDSKLFGHGGPQKE